MLNLREFFNGQTLVFGHRGAKSYAPMNTIPAFELAWQQGAHGIELDVHRSKDGYPVIVHDFTIDHTTNSTGLVTDKTLKELKELDAGSWFSYEYEGVQIPTLDEVFESVGQKLIVNVEIKSLDTDVTDGVEQVVADCILRHAMQDRVVVSSFNPYTLLRFRQILPDCALGFLYEDSVPLDSHAIMAGHVYEAYHPYFVAITPEMVAEQHAQGRVINTWTVNQPQDARRLRDWGVDCLITDCPDRILDALRA
jgi:glycerophosphoryl diester phosphodiesterase